MIEKLSNQNRNKYLKCSFKKKDYFNKCIKIIIFSYNYCS